MNNARTEILNNVKLRLRDKYDVSTIELVEKLFWTTLRYYLTRPEEVKGGIMLNKFVKINLKLGRIKWKLENQEWLPETKKTKYKQILKINDYE
jgi:hypothetical protein